jgi:hypothetical protein
MATRNGTLKSRSTSTRPPGNTRGNTSATKQPQRSVAAADRPGAPRARRRNRSTPAESRAVAQPTQRHQADDSSINSTRSRSPLQAVTAHPIPAAMIGAGVAWLLVETLGRRSQILLRAGESLSQAAGGLKRRAEDFAESVKDGVSSAAESVKEGAGTAAEYAQSGLSTVGQTARRGYEASTEAVTQSWENHPFAMGVATLAAGLTAGLLLPRGNRGR